MKFLLVSSRGDGAGVAHRLVQEGHDVRWYVKAPWARPLLKGMVQQVPTLQAGVDWHPEIIVFDMVGMGAEADRLRSLGFRVFGGGKWNDRLELDRKFASKTMDSLGIRSPKTYAFGSIKEAMRFATEHPKRLILKPSGNKNTSYTYAGQSQDDLISYMAYLKRSLGVDGEMILQEFIRGTEVSTELWFSEGQPVPFPNSTIEFKKLCSGECGPSTGCQGSFVWTYPMRQPKIVQQSLKKMFVFMEHTKYTGPMDINGIVKNGRFYGLEFSPRLGYSAVYALSQILKEPLGDLIARVARGDASPMRTQEGFGYSVRVSVAPYPYASEDTKENQKIYERLRGLLIGGLSKPEWQKHVFPLDVQATPVGYSVAGVDGAVLELAVSGMSPWECEMKATELFKKLELPHKQARLGDMGNLADRRIQDLRMMGYEVPPDFVQTKPHRPEELLLAAVPVQKEEKQEEEKEHGIKDDRAAIAAKIGCRPGAIAHPIHRGVLPGQS